MDFISLNEFLELFHETGKRKMILRWQAKTGPKTGPRPLMRWAGGPLRSSGIKG
jgi:hypothetical protein